MASSQIAAMLDELMGRNRNVAPHENARELQWFDPEICRYYIVDFCPHDLFTNTKADLGPCGKIHDDDLKRKFTEEKETHYKKSQYVDEFLRFCQRMLTELQTRIRKAKERLLLTQQQEEQHLALSTAAAANGPHKDTEDKINLITERMNQLVEEAEASGCEGNVEKAQGLMKLSDQLRDEREYLKRSITPFYGKDEYNAQQQKAMEVCDTCGAFLIVGDAQQRIDDHLMGKQHIGYAKLRSAVDALLEEKKKVREEREKEMEERRKKRDAELEERKKKREASEEEEHSRKKKKEEAKRSSQSRKRSRERDRDRDRERDRDRDLQRRKRSRSKDRRRSRSRDKKRSRSRDQRRRSRERDSHHRRRSRSRDRNSDRKRDGRTSRRSRSKDRDRDSRRHRDEKSREKSSRDKEKSSSSSSGGKDKKKSASPETKTEAPPKEEEVASSSASREEKEVPTSPSPHPSEDAPQTHNGEVLPQPKEEILAEAPQNGHHEEATNATSER